MGKADSAIRLVQSNWRGLTRQKRVVELSPEGAVLGSAGPPVDLRVLRYDVLAEDHLGSRHGFQVSSRDPAFGLPTWIRGSSRNLKKCTSKRSMQGCRITDFVMPGETREGRKVDR